MLEEIIKGIMLNSIFEDIERTKMKKYKLTNKEKQFLLWIIRKKSMLSTLGLLKEDFTAKDFKRMGISEEFYIETRKRLKYIKVINEKCIYYKALRVKKFKGKKGVIPFNTIKLFSKGTY